MDMFDKYMQVMYDRDAFSRRIGELEKEVAELKAKVAIAKCDMRVVKTLLEDIQWVYQDEAIYTLPGYVCPCCGESANYGHFQGSFDKGPCLLACVLSRSEAYEA
ncbi:hypothetical protein BIZ94_gp042 [Pseudomonas phage vB_PaeM_MAG1]|uniref:Uncharacterized protein n=1 Tax=Pseudomonas phage vB_PaeM_MAG1 TaxID=1639815 RepID=A0A172CKT4_9CAUD|nr:hypothetical protein BIZ94_gp042 [Pseudomonas phage vB_PaeM_MAG1]ALA12022.1 hypothetical protein vB_PaeM_MAG1_042 [Pseudomonas phage vB_PaeM_MAG1]